MKKKNVLFGGMLAMVLVLGMIAGGCASYAALMDKTTPGWREMEPIKVNPGGGGSSGSGSSGGSGSSSGGGSSGGGGSSSAQQPPANQTITRTYSYNVSSAGQAGGGAAAQVRAQNVADASERFRRENPGYEIRNTEVTEGVGTMTVTVTGRRS